MRPPSPPCLPGLFSPPGRPVAQPVKQEIDRLNAAARRVLARLQTGPATNVELSTPECGGLRAVGRIDELREFYDIRKEHVSGGLWRYSYHGRRSWA